MERERRKEYRVKHKKKKHRLDIRGVIPLFFRRYYFVILIGRDTREETKVIEADRRYKVKRVNNFVSTVLLLIPIIIMFLLILYYLKSALGINIMPEKHLGDLTDSLYRTLDRMFNLD